MVIIRSGWWTALLLNAAVCMTLCQASHAAQPILHLANAGEPQTLDPHRYNLRLEETLLNDLFLGLTTFDAAGETVPGAAVSWETSDDGLTWKFHLRNGMRWSDGTPVTAHDFVYSFRRLQDPATAASLAYFMYMLKNAEAVNRGDLPSEALGVEAPDDATLVLRLDRPYPYLLERLLYPTAYPVPRHAIERHADAWIKPGNWVSNGAYMLEDWQPQAHVALRRNPHFHTPAAIEHVQYHPVVNEQSAYNRFRNGELHVIGAFPVGELQKVAVDYPVALRVSDLLSMMYLVFNTGRPPFGDVRVRQALSMAVDQQILTERVLRSGSKPAYSFVPYLIDGYRATELPHTRVAYAQRLAQARQLLAHAGFSAERPLEVELRHISGVDSKKVNLAITGMWKQIGVRAVLHQAELKNHFSDLRQGKFDIAWAGWIGENNPEHYLTLLQSDIGNVNYGRFNLPAYDAIVSHAQSMASLPARNARLQQAEALMVHHYPVVPLYTAAVRRLVSTQVAGWHENLRDVHQVRYLTFDP